MPPAPKKYDLDLSQIGDEELVVMAKECGYQPATQELLVRFHDWTNRLIAQQAKHTRLTATDVEDAQQNAVFALLEAVTRYDALEMVKPNGCGFRPFLRLVLTARFRDFVKHVRRVERAYENSIARAGAGDHALDAVEVRAARQAGHFLETT